MHFGSLLKVIFVVATLSSGFKDIANTTASPKPTMPESESVGTFSFTRKQYGHVRSLRPKLRGLMYRL